MEVRVMENSMTWLTPESAEWETTWKRLYDALEAKSLSRATHNGEAWQYMGSTALAHSFRHRREHNTNRRVYVTLPTNGGPANIHIMPAPSPVEATKAALPLVHLDRNSSPAGETCPTCGKPRSEANAQCPGEQIDEPPEADIARMTASLTERVKARIAAVGTRPQPIKKRPHIEGRDHNPQTKGTDVLDGPFGFHPQSSPKSGVGG